MEESLVAIVSVTLYKIKSSDLSETCDSYKSACDIDKAPFNFGNLDSGSTIVPPEVHSDVDHIDWGSSIKERTKGNCALCTICMVLGVNVGGGNKIDCNLNPAYIPDVSDAETVVVISLTDPNTHETLGSAHCCVKETASKKESLPRERLVVSCVIFGTSDHLCVVTPVST